MIVRLLPLLLLISIYQTSVAQDYILTAKGDSLVGEVKPLLYGSEKKVQLISDDDEKMSFSIFEVRAFSSAGETYHPVKGENGYVFMKLLRAGYLSLYAYQPENQTRFDGLFLRKLDGASMVVPNLGFKKYMSRFLEDCPHVADRIQSGELGKRDLDEIIDTYNGCIQRRTTMHEQVIAGRADQRSKLDAWIALEASVRSRDFAEKTNALEMIAEVSKKIQRGESIPNFLLEALRNSLQNTGLSEDLEAAIESSRS